MRCSILRPFHRVNKNKNEREFCYCYCFLSSPVHTVQQNKTAVFNCFLTDVSSNTSNYKPYGIINQLYYSIRTIKFCFPSYFFSTKLDPQFLLKIIVATFTLVSTYVYILCMYRTISYGGYWCDPYRRVPDPGVPQSGPVSILVCPFHVVVPKQDGLSCGGCAKRGSSDLVGKNTYGKLNAPTQ